MPSARGVEAIIRRHLIVSHCTCTASTPLRLYLYQDISITAVYSFARGRHTSGSSIRRRYPLPHGRCHPHLRHPAHPRLVVARSLILRHEAACVRHFAVPPLRELLRGPQHHTSPPHVANYCICVHCVKRRPLLLQDLRNCLVQFLQSLPPFKRRANWMVRARRGKRVFLTDCAPNKACAHHVHAGD
jgi:hypothetical protein